MTDNKRIQTALSERVKSFDLCALFKLLLQMGYRVDDIFFQSNADLSSCASLCEELIFSESYPKVTLVLNLGLLSVNSPLPHFFRKKMDSGSIDPVQFTKFINFFDHYLIKNLLCMSMPEIDGIFFDNWNKTQNYYLKFLDLHSTSTLWHLFQLCYPELQVQFIKSPKLFKEESSSIMLGSSLLGYDSFLGKKIEHTIPSFKVILTGEDTVTDQLIAWPQEVKTRLKNILYFILERTSIHFRIYLIIKNNKDIAKLSSSCYLGYCRIGENDLPLKLLLFAGYSKNLNQLRIG